VDATHTKELKGDATCECRRLKDASMVGLDDVVAWKTPPIASNTPHCLECSKVLLKRHYLLCVLPLGDRLHYEVNIGPSVALSFFFLQNEDAKTAAGISVAGDKQLSSRRIPNNHPNNEV
jgi:hypothetical protein